MATFQEILNSISPFNSATNPTGSKKITYISESPIINQSNKKVYHVAYSLDNGETKEEADIAIFGIDVNGPNENWYFRTTPIFLNKNIIFQEKIEDQINSWWTSTGKNIYAAKGQIFSNPYLKYGGCKVSKSDGGSPPKLVVKTLYWLKVDANKWIQLDGMATGG